MVKSTAWSYSPSPIIDCSYCIAQELCSLKTLTRISNVSSFMRYLMLE